MTRAPFDSASATVESVLPESTTTISSHHFTESSTLPSRRSAFRVMRTAESGGLGKRPSVGDEGRPFDMGKRQLLRELVQPAENAFFLGADIIVPENHSAGLQHPERLLGITHDIRVGMRAVDEDQVAGADV